jgi:SAM-dependent methyltransferase
VTLVREATVEAGKWERQDRDTVERSLNLLIRIASELGTKLAPEDRVLDLGCGIGESVEVLLSRGIDAYGIDVGEWWGEDYDAYWQKAPPPPANVRERLQSIDENSYVLPYPDDSFALIISWETFEHVFNYETVFREIRRVLRPDGLSVNIFPGRWSPVEPHVCIPITGLCKYNWWLASWALLRGNPRTWRTRYLSWQRSMKLTSYPSRDQLRKYAVAAGLNIEFCEKLYVECSASRPNSIVRVARRFGLVWAASAVVERLCQRTMVLRKGTASEPAR